MTGLTVPQRVGMRVRAARDAVCMTQQELGTRIGLARTSVTNLEAGRQDIPMSKLALIAEVLRLDLADLVRAEDLAPAPHKVTVRCVFEVHCSTCGGLVGETTARSEAVASRHAHIVAHQKAAAS